MKQIKTIWLQSRWGGYARHALWQSPNGKHFVSNLDSVESKKLKQYTPTGEEVEYHGS